jgi:glycosyltransferase involved in cell wall biosynthesis
MTGIPRSHYSLVIPVFNEEAVLPLLMHRLEALLQRINGTVEVIFVDDGSSDSSPIFLQAKARIDHRFKFIGLSRNFGQQVAITAGLDAARGDAVIVMDGDLQDPPELILAMIEKWQEGYEVVCAKRLHRDEDTYFKRATAHVFYHMINRLSSVRIPENVGDFRLLDRKVVDAFKNMPERTRFVRGMFSWLGFREAFVEFDRPSRPAGKTKYSALRLFRLAATYVVAFSDMPLRLVVWCGCLVSATALVYGLGAIYYKITGGVRIEGWTSTIVVLSFLCGANMLMTGIIGLYVGRIYAEVKQRPLYVVNRREGFNVEARQEGGSLDQAA